MNSTAPVQPTKTLALAISRRPLEPIGANPKSPNAAQWSPSRQLMDVQTAAFELDWRMERVELWVYSGKFPSFDIRGKTSSIACLRIFAPAVIAARNGVHSASRLTAQQMIAAILPGTCETFSQSRVAWLFHSTTGHIVRLCQTRCLSEGGFRGRQGARNISRSSLVRFLLDRRVTR